MEVKIWTEGPNTAAAMATFLIEWHKAKEADQDYWNKKHAGDPFASAPVSVGSLPAATLDSEPVGQTEEAPKKSQRGGRRYGQPSAGKARRTKEELAEDAELDGLSASLGHAIPEDEPVADLLIAWRAESAAKAEEPQRAITATPEDRQPVEEPKVVTGEIVDDFFGDEPAPVYTKDDLKKALEAVFKAKGNDMPATSAWLEKVAGVRKMSEVAEDKFGLVIAAAQKEAA
jgi:hypothetical protein